MSCYTQFGMPRDQIQEVKDKLDIVELVSSYIPLQKSGKNYKALCPFHSEKTPSFMVSPTLQIFKCFGCGEGGDAIAFYGKMEGVAFGEALKEMAKRGGVKLVSRKESPEERQREKLYELNRLAADFYHFLLTEHKIGSNVREFLKRRGVDKQTIEDFGLGYSPSSWDSLGRFIMKKGYSVTELLQSGLAVRKEGGRGYFDFFRGRLMFPLRSPLGKVIGFAGRIIETEGPKDAPTSSSGLVSDQGPKDGSATAEPSFVPSGPKYMNTTETPVFEKRRFLFNLDLAKQAIKKERTAVLVEGEMDAIVLFEKGIKNVVASKGTALSGEQLSSLAKFAQKLLICFDRDTAGLEATKKGLFLAQSGGLEVRAVLLPEGKDPDEAILADPTGFKKLLASAPPVFNFYLDSALGRFDPATPEGKKAISSEVLPVLKSLANEVEKAAYLSQLAQKIGIEEEILWKQLEKENLPDFSAEETSPRSPVSSPIPKRESCLLALLFGLPPQKVPSAQRRVAADDLTDPKVKEILVALREYLKSVKRFRLENFSAKLEENLRHVLEELVLAPLEEDSPEALETEFVEVLAVVRGARLTRERRELVRQVREAEQVGETSRVRRLQREILKLTEKIDSARIERSDGRRI